MRSPWSEAVAVSAANSPGAPGCLPSVVKKVPGLKLKPKRGRPRRPDRLAFAVDHEDVEGGHRGPHRVDPVDAGHPLGHRLRHGRLVEVAAESIAPLARTVRSAP